MTISLRDATVVLLPGTGSDDDYVYRAFSGALHAHGASVVTPAPEPADLVGGYERALEQASLREAVLVGGVSIGAAVATAWAIAHPARTLGVLAALPAWTGAPNGAPAALAAAHSAQALRQHGLLATIAEMRAGTPTWLADELSRSWLEQWPDLPDAMEQAAAYVAPTTSDLGRLSVPMGLVAAIGDAVHPVEVALEWLAAAPHAALRTITLDQLGADAAVLGTECVAALLEASG